MNNIGLGNNPIFTLLLLGGIPHEYLILLIVFEPIIQTIYKKFISGLNLFDRYVKLEIGRDFIEYIYIINHLQKNKLLQYPFIEYTGSFRKNTIRDHHDITYIFEGNPIFITFGNKIINQPILDGNATKPKQEQIIILKAKNMKIIEKYIKVCRDFDKTISKNYTHIWMNNTKSLSKIKITKTFGNIYIHPDTRDKLVNDLQSFIKNKKQYKEHGIPYKRGYMFYGVPGCGKSSTVYAISHLLRRSVYMIKISNMNNLMKIMIGIPKNSIVVIEEIDRLNIANSIYVPKDRKTLETEYGKNYRVSNQTIKNIIGDIVSEEHKINDDDYSIVLAIKNTIENIIKYDDFSDKFYSFFKIIPKYTPNLINKYNINHIYNKSDNSTDNSDNKTLMELMESFDGYNYLHGCIVIITTNHPEKINPVLIRPGRIDMHINFVEADRNLIINIFTDYFKDVLSKKIKKDLSKFSGKMIQANVINNIVLPNINNYTAAVNALLSS